MRCPAFPDYRVDFGPDLQARVREEVGNHLADSDSYPNVHAGERDDCQICQDDETGADSDSAPSQTQTTDDEQDTDSASDADADGDETDSDDDSDQD